jgi:ABC-2 type transport system permease protein
VGNGAMSLAQENIWPAVFGAAGAFGIGGLGLWRAYRSTLRFYQGQAAYKSITKKPKTEKLAPKRSNFLERRLPGVPEEAAASALAFFRALIRAPEVKMALATNVFMILVLGVIFFVRRPDRISENFKPFVVTGAITFMFLGMSQFMFNQFGFDRAGFRTLALSPVPRRLILLGKNLALLPFAGVIGLTLIVLVKFALRIPFVYVLAASLQLLAAFFLLSIVGNLLSVLVPYRIAPGSLKPTKSSTKTNLLIFASRLLFPTAMLPIFLVPALALLFSSLGWLKAATTNFFLSAVLFGLLAFFYRLSLVPLGELLQRREKQILQVVTKEVE